jgi:hypothetical protein
MSSRRLAGCASLAAALLLAVVASGCVHHHHHAPAPSHASQGHGHGPPPWAPAHGYRHKHHDHGVELVFDAGLGVYLVAGHRYHFYDRSHYYRLHKGSWQISAHLRGPWRHVALYDVPRGLQRHHARDHRGRGHGKHKKKH